MFSRRTQGCDPAQLEALLSAIYAARLATGIELSDVARAARSARVGREPLRDAQLLLLGLATRFTAGYAAAAPTLSKALGAYRNEEPRLDLSSLSYNIVAMELWDDQAWLELASGQAELARATGTLSLLPYTLDYLAQYHIQAGALRVAAGVLTEREGLEMGLKAETLPYVPLLLAVWRGQASTALELIEEMHRGAHARGEGCAITVAEYAAAILYNSLGQYEAARGMLHAPLWISYQSGPVRAAPTGHGEPGRVRAPSLRMGNRPKTSTARRSTGSANVE